jgi:hypothetical protein
MANPNQGAGAETRPDRAPEDAADDTYEPSTAEVNRGREQGLGVGQKDIDYQRDPTRAESAEQYARSPDAKGGQPDAGRRRP